MARKWRGVSVRLGRDIAVFCRYHASVMNEASCNPDIPKPKAEPVEVGKGWLIISMVGLEVSIVGHTLVCNANDAYNEAVEAQWQERLKSVATDQALRLAHAAATHDVVTQPLMKRLLGKGDVPDSAAASVLLHELEGALQQHGKSGDAPVRLLRDAFYLPGEVAQGKDDKGHAALAVAATVKGMKQDGIWRVVRSVRVEDAMIEAHTRAVLMLLSYWLGVTALTFGAAICYQQHLLIKMKKSL